MAMIRFTLASLCIVPALLPGELATAQEASDILVCDQQAVVRPRPERGETVRNRARPKLDPLGIRRGAFTVLPGLEVREVYNDNIFSEDEGKIDDFITLVTPNLLARSDWRNHQLNLGANATIGRYANESDENFEDFSVGLDGRLRYYEKEPAEVGR